MPKSIKYINLLFILLSLFSCEKQKKQPTTYQFELLNSEKTGINFSNDLKATKAFNFFDYMYFYNGAGVGAGDFNNDGLIDICFGSNQEASKIYLNKGSLKFEDITEKANFKMPLGWTTGISVVDINQDGMLDIYISRVGDFSVLKTTAPNSHNLLFVCQKIENGVSQYKELSHEYGLDLVGFGTQAAFFDYDLDGDLDMFQLTHSVHQNNTFAPRDNFKDTFHPLAGDKLFSPLAPSGGITKYVENNWVGKTPPLGAWGATALGYGLGIAIGDINLDGYPDMYIGNDFHENDYLYINQKNGSGSAFRFKEEINQQMMHTSRYTMGVDIGDITNDAFSEIISLDMLPNNPQILKRSDADDSYNLYKMKIQQGYNYQFPRNNLQLNNGNNTFSEVGMLAGIYATDWSWSPLFIDFDNDGLKDIFISNGIPKRMNDTDYINFISNENIQTQMNSKQIDENDPSLIDKLPEIKLPNKFFSNQANLNGTTLRFNDLNEQILNDQPSFSNGAVSADLDNDGDLDIITNNINQKAFIYENKANENNPQNKSLTIKLKGDSKNLNAIGSKCLVFRKNKTVQLQEKFPVHGFESSSEIPLQIGLGNVSEIDSILVIWATNHYQKIDVSALKFIKNQAIISLTYQPKLPIFDYKLLALKPQTVPFEDIASKIGLDIKHEENEFIDFDRETLLPNMLSTEGPALAVGDVNNDGLEDVFLGASRGKKGVIMLQNTSGKFIKKPQPVMDKDSVFENIDAIFIDVNNDKNLDLVVVNGGNELSDKNEYHQPKVYLNDGKGNFMPKNDAFSTISLTASCVKAVDFNKDGNLDLFIGGRAISANYGDIPTSYLLKNDGTGKFIDVTQAVAPELSKIGFVKNATWQDMDKDGDEDLLLAMEWDGILLLENKQGKFTKKALTKEKGWWNFTLPQDFDNDGDIDILVGNLGLNSRLKATEKEPVKMYVNDFDGNGQKEQILTYFIENQEVVFPSKMDIEKQMPFLKKKYLLAKDFSQAKVVDLVGEKPLADAQKFEANYFSNAVLVNDGKGNFTLKALPNKAQITPYFDAQMIDANNDKLPDILIMGNFYDCTIQLGRYDADYGTILINKGACNFEPVSMNNLAIKGQVRRLRKIKVGNDELILAARNNDKLVAIKAKKP